MTIHVCRALVVAVASFLGEINKQKTTMPRVKLEYFLSQQLQICKNGGMLILRFVDVEMWQTFMQVLEQIGNESIRRVQEMESE